VIALRQQVAELKRPVEWFKRQLFHQGREATNSRCGAHDPGAIVTDTKLRTQ
jgi:hypothetical protein